MLEKFIGTEFNYQKLSLEEQKSRGILGRLKGVIADSVNPTRNGRLYGRELWETVFNDPIMKEKIESRTVMGELGHPADRTEIDMEKVALCLAETPKFSDDGKLYGVFDILNTPNGRILKSLCDYGCHIGVSSRGEGEVTGDEVDPESYVCECWDAVLLPAVKEARMDYVTESLNKKRYNKTLKDNLTNIIGKENDSNKKAIKESLDLVGIKLDEDVLTEEPSSRFDGLQNYSNIVDAEIKRDLERSEATYKAFCEKIKRKLEELAALENVNLARHFFNNSVFGGKVYYTSNNLDDWTNDNWATSEKGFICLSVGLRNYEDEDGDSFYENEDDCSPTCGLSLTDGSLYICDYRPPKINDNRTYIVCENFWQILYDNSDAICHEIDLEKDRLMSMINARNSILQEKEFLWDAICLCEDCYNLKINDFKKYIQPLFFNNFADMCTLTYEGKTLLSKPNDSDDINTLKIIFLNLAGDITPEGYLNIIKEKIKPLYDYVDELIASKQVDMIEESKKETKNKCTNPSDCADKKEVEKQKEDPKKDKKDVADGKPTGDGNSIMLFELQEALKAKRVLEASIASLQDKLAVSDAKARSLDEELVKYKELAIKLSDASKQARELSKQVENYKEKFAANRKALSESVEKTNTKVTRLTEALANSKSALEKTKAEYAKVSKDYAELQEDYQIKTDDYSRRLTKANKLAEAYKKAASDTMSRYIESKALMLGITKEEIRNRLSESYTAADVDKVCEDLRAYRLNISRLPFSVDNKVKVRFTESKNDNLRITNLADEIDDDLLEMAKL